MTIDEDVQRPREARVRGLIAAVMALMLVTALLSLAAVGYLALRATNQSEDNGDGIAQIQQINERLVDCTEPGGKCFESAQRRTGEAIVGINEGTLAVIVAAISCQEDGITEERPLARCTVRRARLAESQQ